ncbi:hypothetical protein [Amycolatopsis sp. lyj-23]|uniref:hypothetical protein n=1 Tax=Amycolatopsis sp. lyj-23 TaxID=2789283 RepID=UPI00397A2496
MTYDFDGCGPQVFERMAQALCAAELGPGIVVFGPGRDGGREATFDGPVAVISHGHRWSGYIVVQAKHKSHTGVPKDDADWVIKQIHGELTPWVEGSRTTPVPQYYLLITNVRLSAFPGAGGRDRIVAVLEEYREKLGFVGFHVWDGETLEAMLDGHFEVRRRYAAWVTAGDVLATLFDELKPAVADLKASIPVAAAKELLARRSARLDEAGDRRRTRSAARVGVRGHTGAVPVAEPGRSRLGSGTGEFAER